MTFSIQQGRALELLARTGLPRNRYEPMLFRLLWAYGLELPPPHFAAFGSNLRIFGAGFALPFGLLIWAALWARQGHGGGFLVVNPGAAGHEQFLQVGLGENL